MTKPSLPTVLSIAVTFLVAAAGILWLPGCEDEPLAPWLEAPPEFVTTWGTFGLGDGNFYSPTGIAVDDQDNVYVTDANYRRVQKFTKDGEFLGKWALQGVGEDESEFPYDLVIGADGTMTVDIHNRGVVRFAADGSFLADIDWSSPPFGLAKDEARTIYALRTQKVELSPLNYRYTPQILKLSPGGAPFDTLELPSFISDYYADTTAVGWFFNSLAVDSQGNLYVAGAEKEMDKIWPTWRSEIIWKVSPTGEVLDRPLYASDRSGDGRSRLFEGIAVDADGFVFVADWGFDEILKIDSLGHVVCVWGTVSPGHNPLAEPLGLCLDSAGDIYVSDNTNHRVVKYGYPDGRSD